MFNSRLFLKYWLPVLLWMAVIFLASLDSCSYEHSSRLLEPLLRWLFPQLPQSAIDTVHTLLRKCAHLTEYAILALLLWRAIGNTRGQKLPKPRQTLALPGGNNFGRWEATALTLAIVFLYAASDEFHQSFVPTRSPMLSDVFIDTCGGAVGLLVLWIYGLLSEKIIR